MKKKKKNRLSGILLIVCFVVGLSLVLYPSFSNYWNNVYSTHAIAVYSEKTRALDEEQYKEIWEAAWNYNQGIQASSGTTLNDDQKVVYENLLNIGESGIMGYIEIPAIEVTLPISHGTSEEVLRTGVGHVDWSSLPVGGEGTHCVLSGHRGLPSAKLFTHLDKLALGDIFMIRVLDEVLIYEVDQILIVAPTDTESLRVVPNEDYCTLVTCTPYGINTHRLLVRGHRVEDTDFVGSMHITAEAVQVEPLLIAAILGVPALIVMIILVFALGGRRKKRPWPRRKDK